MALKCKMGLPGCVFIVLDLRLIKCTSIVLNIASQALLLSRHTISAGSSAITCWLTFLIFILLFLKSTAEGYIKRKKGVIKTTLHDARMYPCLRGWEWAIPFLVSENLITRVPYYMTCMVEKKNQMEPIY